MKVYISGPITGRENGNREAFAAAATYVEREGGEAVNPHELNHQHGGTWAEYMRVDLRALTECDSVFMLEGWQDSKGSVIELQTAISLGLSIEFQNEFTKGFCPACMALMDSFEEVGHE